MSRILTIALTTSLLSTAAGAAPSLTAPGPRPETTEAVQCILRQTPAGCIETMFQKGRAQTTAIRWVSQSREQDFNRGPFVSSTYWGRDTKIGVGPDQQGDVFDVKFAHVEYTFYILSADADGKIKAWSFGQNPPHDRRQLRLQP